jgi:polyisoprenoid-binding protein YceI
MYRLLSAAVIALIAAGCSSEIDNKPAAEVTPAEQAEAPADAAARTADGAADADGPPEEGLKHAKAAPEGSETHDVDLANSKFEFVGAKVTGDHTCSFKQYDGEVVIKGGKVLSTSFEIDLSSVETDKEKLTKHLKSADFFDVEKFARATFVSASIKPGSEAEGANSTVVGTLDFHGVKNTISFPANIQVTDDMVTTKAEFTLLREDFGVSYPGKPDDLIKNEVLIKLDLKFPTS